MKNVSFSRWIAEALPIVAFNTVYFLLVEEFSASRWVGWACLHVAYLVLVLSGRQTTSNGMSVVFGFPRIATSCTLFIMTAMAFAVIFCVNPASTKWPTIIEVIASVASLCLYFVINTAESSAREDDTELKQNLMFIKTCSGMLLSAKGAVADVACRKSIEKAYDAVRNGNVSSVPTARALEAEIRDAVEGICALTETEGAHDRINALTMLVLRKMATRENIIRNLR